MQLFLVPGAEMLTYEIHSAITYTAYYLHYRALSRYSASTLVLAFNNIAADRKIGAYSKGMRQRVRLAQSIAHQPAVLILDEPLNGLDPMVRAETIALFKQLAAEGLHLIISSHILHEVDMMSDRVVLLNNGYVVAEGAVHGVRDEMDVEHPMQILIRCDQPSSLAARLFQNNDLVEARVHDDRHGLFVKTRNPDRFYLMLNEVVASEHLNIESIAPVDDDLSAVYEYLIGDQ